MIDPISALGSHARAVLLAFDDVAWPHFEAHVLHMAPLWAIPLSLRSEVQVAAALAELEAVGLVRTWTPSAEDLLRDKPHPQLCLRKYWPEGRIWVRGPAWAGPYERALAAGGEIG